MKKLTMIATGAVLAILTLSYSVSYAQQWATSGSNIYNTNSGNVGIGTGAAFTPAEKLHINNVANIAGVMAESSYTGTSMKAIGYYRIKNTATGDMFNMVLRKNGAVHEMLQSCYDASASLWREFICYNYATRKYEMRAGVIDAEFKNSGNLLFNNTGNVGIGTSNPTEKLSVNGNIKCRQVEVSLSGWSDFVFQDDYSLMSLAELDNYIKENNHLPGVPSTEEVMTNGNNLGEMDAILLQKIEELTLYVIELKKENEILKTQISGINE
jgi:hypothetical protein